MMDKEPISLSNEGMDAPPELPMVTYINVNGREEHESIIKDAKMCEYLGIDQVFEIMKYLKRWGGWLNGTENGNI